MRRRLAARRSTATATSVSLGTTFTLTANTWYRLELGAQRTGTADTFSYSLVLEDWGLTGAAFVSTKAGGFNGTFANSTLYNDTTTYAGFRALEGQTGAAVAFDSLVVVPEPASALLALCGGAALLLRRRRGSV